MKNIIGLTEKNIREHLKNSGLQPFRAKQIFQFLYHKGVQNYENMTNVGRETLNFLKNNFAIRRPEIVTVLKDEDGTAKWLLRLEDGALIETVYIPEKDRGAVCVSTQVGCPNACAFCRTGTQGFIRNLTVDEIVGQFMVVKDAYNEWGLGPEDKRKLTNIVMMGMGEPLYNMDNVEKALDLLMDPEGLSISKRRITVSTSGVVPMIPRLAQKGVKLALSLHATTDETRNKIMPLNKKYPINDVLKALKDYQKITGKRNAITIEYTLIDGLNDTAEDAKRLIAFSKGLMLKFNLIPMNEWEGCGLKASPLPVIEKFASYLTTRGFAAPIRASRGQRIKAACGQLRTDTEKRTKNA